MSWQVAVVTFLIAAAGANLGAAGCCLARRPRAGMSLAATGWLLSAFLFMLNWLACGHPPFGNMYHTLVVLSLCFLPVLAILRRRGDSDWLTGHFAAAAAVPLLGALFMERNVFWQRVPALQSPWFVPHVLAYMLAYALATVAFLLSLAALWQARRGDPGEETPRAQAVYRILRLAFPFMTFGLLSGALWAEEAWGVYWSWDSKETWSLITWTLYLLYFHCRLHRELRRLAMPAQVLAFAALVVTFLLVNLLPKLGSVLHSYS